MHPNVAARRFHDKALRRSAAVGLLADVAFMKVIEELTGTETNGAAQELLACTTLHEVLAQRARVLGERIAYTFEGGQQDQSITFAELDRRARGIASQLQGQVKVGDRVLLLFPAGLDFIAAFFGCLYAGALAVPTTYPKPRRPMPRLTSIALSCSAVAALTDNETLSTIDQSIRASQLPDMKWLSVDEFDGQRAHDFSPVAVGRNDLAFLQYTSGSTNDPKGVMVSHGNLLHNLEMIRQGFGLKLATESMDGQKGVFWLPAYHDMGLIGGILESLYVGGHSILMSPAAFLQRPMSWLENMSKYRAAVSGAPNFAYELCLSRSTEEQRAELDLSHWEVAFCGAEPIRAETFRRFSKAFAISGLRDNVFYPCYGLAEGTLLAAGPKGPGRLETVSVCRAALAMNDVKFVDEAEGHLLVSCGGPHLGQRIAIVDPETRVELPANRIGEIWVQGQSVAQGYWNRPEDTRETFEAYLASPTGSDLVDAGKFMRTGDLGFGHDGHLVVAARVKDVIIIRGRNHYPQDIEQSIADSHEALRPDAGAVFSIEQDGQEKIVAIHEVDRQYRNTDFDEIIRCMRAAVAQEHELEVSMIVLIRHMSLPRTTSGKPQRHVCRRQFEAGELKVVAEWSRAARKPPRVESMREAASAAEQPIKASEQMTPEEIDRFAERIESWLLNWLIERAAIPAEEVDSSKPFAEYGLDSLTAVELSQELEDWVGVEVVPTVAWNYPTPAALSAYLARCAAGTEDAAPSAVSPVGFDNEFDQLLAEIESLSDEAIHKLLDE